MMAAAGGDRLSGLSDDLLRRVLHFVPAQEGAITSALSRRWRPLWRSCGAVNVVARALKNDDDRVRFYSRRDDDGGLRFYARRDAVVSAAHKALDAAADGDVPVTRLTVRVEASSRDEVRDFLHRDVDWRNKHDVFAGVLSHRAARHVEELQIAGVDSDDGTPMYFETSKYEACPNIYGLGIFPLALASQPRKTLRVLELTNCSDLVSSGSQPPRFFPRLESLRLRHCNVPLKNLQDIIDSAPLLAVIHLDSVLLEADETRNQRFHDHTRPPPEQGRLLGRTLRCRAATAMVLDRCSMKEESTLEIYAPMLRRFRYRGVLRHISLSPPPPHLARAELTLVEHGYVRDRDPRAARRSFWGTVHGFRHAKEMKLSVRTHLQEIATTNDTRRAKLLPTLRCLERLELQGVYTPARDVAAAAIENLLCCCPALRDLRINLTTSHEDANKKSQYGEVFLERKCRSEFEESVHRFKRRRSQPTVAGDEDDDANYDEVSDLPGLSGQHFECLQRCLTRVGLQFRRQQKTDCLGIKLIKFFAENAKVLKEMCVDAGNERIGEHMNLKIQKWIDNKSKRRRINSPGATKVQVLSLTRSD